QPVEQGRANAADVQIARGTGSEARANHQLYSIVLPARSASKETTLAGAAGWLGMQFAGRLAEGPEPAAPLRAVARQRVREDRQGRRRRLDVIDLDRLAFQHLVILKEAAQHGQSMGRQFVGLAEAVVLRIVDGHGQDLVVLLAAVDHGYQADAAGV